VRLTEVVLVFRFFCAAAFPCFSKDAIGNVAIAAVNNFPKLRREVESMMFSPSSQAYLLPGSQNSAAKKPR
jgi:hypothetical protein